MNPLIQSLRPVQWIKNLLIFLPLIFGGRLFDPPIAIRVLAAFGLFCLASSSAYVANDLSDLPKDRLHPIKRLRPLAQGRISPQQAWGLALLLGTLGLAGGFGLAPVFGGLLAAYLGLNLLYTVALKNTVIVDVFCIGAFFFLRLLAGGIVAEVVLSHWIVLLGTLLTLFLVFNKRRQDLVLLEGKDSSSVRPSLREYSLPFLDQINSVISTSAGVVYLLYTVDERTVSYVGSTHLIYSVPFVYYGIFRYLYLIYKLRRSEEPIRLLLSDRPLQFNLVLWIIVCVAVLYFRNAP